MIRLEKRGRRIEVITNAPLPGFKSTIPGAYERSNGVWTIPLDYESCILLLKKFPDARTSTELKRWLNGTQTNRKTMSRLASAKTARLTVLPRVAPKLYEATRKRLYQRTGIRFIADNRVALLADEPGLGKTLIAMGGVLESEVPGPYLVIAPKTASRNVWRNEIQRWLPSEHRVVVMPEGRAQRERRLRLTRYGDKTWIIVHPEMVLCQQLHICHKCKKPTVLKSRTQKKLDCKHIKTAQTQKKLVYSYPHLFKIKWGAILVDESHESLIHRMGLPTQRRRGLLTLQLREGGIPLAISGTPFDSKPFQLWGTLNWLDPKTHSAFHRWTELYWQKGGYSGYEIGEFREDREQMLWKSLDGIMLRRTKQEVAPDLPPKQEMGTLLDPQDENSPIAIWLEMKGEQARAYEEMEKESRSNLESGRLEAITAIAELTRLKQLACSYGDLDERLVRIRCESSIPCDECATNGYHVESRFKLKPQLPSNKFDWVTQNLEEWGYPSNPITKVVIVSFYTSLLEYFAQGLEKHFKTKPANPLTTIISGKVSNINRDKIIRRFNEHGNEHIMFLNVQAGGTAITIDSADRMIFLSRTRTPTKETQAEDRIHRVSNPRQCFYYYLNSLGTVDEGTTLLNRHLLTDTHRLLDTRRGVDYLRLAINLSHSREQHLTTKNRTATVSSTVSTQSERGNTMAPQKKPLTSYGKEAPTDFHKWFARWLVSEVKYNPDNASSLRAAFLKGVSLAVATRPAFTESEFLEEMRQKHGVTKRGRKPAAREEEEEEETPRRRPTKSAVAKRRPEPEPEEEDDDFEDDDFEDEEVDEDDDFEDDDSDDDDFEDEVEEEPAPKRRAPAKGNTRTRTAAVRREAPAKKAAPAKKPTSRRATKTDDDDILF